MGRFKRKVNISQIIFMAAFSATVNTILSSYIDWDNRLIAAIISGLVTFIGGILALIFIKND
jgi:uncharacterized membrane protein YjjP (DUF1212 family)